MPDVVPRMTRLVGRARRAVHERTAKPGVEPVDLRALISPLRYDIMVRAHFFDFLADHLDLTDAELVEAATGTTYAAWFDRVECARYFPALLTDDDLRKQRFAARVLGARRLLHSFSEKGFDPAHPVTLIRAATGSPSDSGAPAMGELHIGDGCHRVALLLRAGDRLEPSMYRVRRLLTPLVDNTAVLVGAGVLDEAEYVRHLSGTFPVGNATTVDSARAQVESRAPHHGRDLAAVVAAQWRQTPI